MSVTVNDVFANLYANGIDIDILKSLLKTEGVYCVAGGSIGDSIAKLNILNPEYSNGYKINDIDVFIDHSVLTNNPLFMLLGSKEINKLQPYSRQFSTNSSYDIVDEVKFKGFNLIFINKTILTTLTSKDIIDSFDINCCQAAIIKRSDKVNDFKLVTTAYFDTFLLSKKIQIVSLRNAARTALRLLSKRDNLSDYILDKDEEYGILALMLELRERYQKYPEVSIDCMWTDSISKYEKQYSNYFKYEMTYKNKQLYTMSTISSLKQKLTYNQLLRTLPDSIIDLLAQYRFYRNLPQLALDAATEDSYIPF